MNNMPLFAKLLHRIRLRFYRHMSSMQIVSGKPRIHQPTLFIGKGRIELGKCHLGYFPSPGFFNGYAHIEARHPSASIIIADGVMINNSATIIADRSSIVIGANSLIGHEFTVFDSDFHALSPDARKTGIPAYAPVSIGENVFIGSRVTVLKGVTIGRDSVIASGATVVSDIPPGVIAAGSPARVIKPLPGTENLLHE